MYAPDYDKFLSLSLSLSLRRKMRRIKACYLCDKAKGEFPQEAREAGGVTEPRARDPGQCDAPLVTACAQAGHGLFRVVTINRLAECDSHSRKRVYERRRR